MLFSILALLTQFLKVFRIPVSEGKEGKIRDSLPCGFPIILVAVVPRSLIICSPFFSLNSVNFPLLILDHVNFLISAIPNPVKHEKKKNNSRAIYRGPVGKSGARNVESIKKKHLRYFLLPRFAHGTSIYEPTTINFEQSMT